MNKKPLLTVAIPTYNRSSDLEKRIKELTAQDDHDFNILISDDNSTDDTERLVKKYQKKHKNIFYCKNTKDKGYSGNVLNLYDLADTKYIWFLCDDDTVLPGAIKSINNAINKYKFVAAVFNCSWIDPYGVHRQVVDDKDVVYDDMKSMHDYQPIMRSIFLSILVVEKRISAKRFLQSNYKDNAFFQLTLVLQLLSDKFVYCEIGDTILHRNVGYKYSDFFKFYVVGHVRSVFIMKHKLNNDLFIKWSIRNLRTILPVYFSQKLGLFLYKGLPNRSTLKDMVRFYGVYSIYILSLIPLYHITPTALLEYIYKKQLINIHGKAKGMSIYKKNIGRATRDERVSGFLHHALATND